jgi:hypothetical protein
VLDTARRSADGGSIRIGLSRRSCISGVLAEVGVAVEVSGGAGAFCFLTTTVIASLLIGDVGLTRKIARCHPWNDKTGLHQQEGAL